MIAKLARERAGELVKLAEELEGTNSSTSWSLVSIVVRLGIAHILLGIASLT